MPEFPAAPVVDAVTQPPVEGEPAPQPEGSEPAQPVAQPAGAEGTPPAEGGAEGTEGATIEVLGEKIPLDQVVAGLEALDNKDSWQRVLKQKEMRYAAIRKVLEPGFGIPMDQWGDAELASLGQFAKLEHELRSDPKLVEHLKSSFEQYYREKGATPAQAKVAAAQDVKDIRATGSAAAAVAEPKAAQTDPRLLKLIEDTRADALQVKQALVSQELTRLEGSINTSLDQAMGTHAAAYKEQAEEIEGRVLDRLHKAFDPEGTGEDKTAEILRADYDGRLTPLINNLVQQEVRRLKMLGKQVNASTEPKPKPAVDAPLKGGAGAASVPEPRTIDDLHKRMMAAMGR